MLHHLMWLSLLALIFGTIADATNNISRHIFQYPHDRNQYYKMLTRDAILTADDQGLASTISDFAIDLYLTYSHSTKELNFILSPLFVQSLLSLLYCGTTPNTAITIESALFIEDEKRSQIANEYQAILEPFEKSPYIYMLNSIYINDKYKLLNNFKTLATTHFYASAIEMNFNHSSDNAMKSINKFIQDKTNNFITNLMQSMWFNDKYQELWLVNAIAFDIGSWKYDFNKRLIRNVQFLNDLDNCQLTEFSVDLMTVKATFNYGVIEQLNATVVELPLKNSNLSMVIFLPNACGGFAKMESSLGHNFDFRQLDNDLYHRIVNVKLPVFLLDYEIPNFSAVLSEIGLQTLFNQGVTEFSDMIEPVSNSSSNTPLHVNRYVHNIRIFVHQMNYTVKAVKAIDNKAPASLNIPVPDMTMDRSFMFAIKNLRDVMILGRFVQPNIYPMPLTMYPELK